MTKEGQSRSWFEQNGANFLGVGVFVALGLLVLFGTYCN